MGFCFQREDFVSEGDFLLKEPTHSAATHSAATHSAANAEI